MNAFAKTRQRIIDGYLAETGHNLFVPAQFVDWLAVRPDHEAYPIIYGKSDGEAAREYRISLARRLASGLRITVTREETRDSVVRIVTREYPALVSPVADRRAGGGYQPMEDAHLGELRAQGRTALRAWIARYRGAFEADGVSMDAISAIAQEPSSMVKEAG